MVLGGGHHMRKWKSMKHNHVILHDGKNYRVFERLGKDVPFDAYNPENHLGIGKTVEECLENTTVNLWDIEHTPYEVIFNE
jgi:hypothetical protein